MDKQSGASEMSNSLSQPNPEEVSVRQAEQEEANAMLTGDVAALENLWTDELLAYSTANLYARKATLLGLIANGGLRLRLHRRTTLEVVLDGDRAIAIGNESSQFASSAAGKLMLCSYLNIWKRQADRWRLLGRHVGLITVLDPDQSS